MKAILLSNRKRRTKTKNKKNILKLYLIAKTMNVRKNLKKKINFHFYDILK